MANEQNLKPGGEAHRLTVEEASKGGKASGEARRKKRLMREAFEELLEREYESADGSMVDGTSALAIRVFREAMKGDLKAFEIIRDTTGQKPVERVETVEISEETYERVARALEE
ncbi:MAG: hypothetical protein IJ586_08560 [Alloprevotella sp.]|nr:hypothetical protein [Alloprevotella sp.]MBR1447113.1 hypothetical protein [Alloprevotella sp.]